MLLQRERASVDIEVIPEKTRDVRFLGSYPFYFREELIFGCDICGLKDSIEKVRHHKSEEHGKQNESRDIRLKVAMAEATENKNLTFVGLD